MAGQLKLCRIFAPFFADVARKFSFFSLTFIILPFLYIRFGDAAVAEVVAVVVCVVAIICIINAGELRQRKTSWELFTQKR